MIEPVGVGGSLPVTGINSGAIMKQPVGVGGTLPAGIKSGAMTIRQPVGVGGTPSADGVGSTFVNGSKSMNRQSGSG